jgi:hypothetical protein
VKPYITNVEKEKSSENSAEKREKETGYTGKVHLHTLTCSRRDILLAVKSQDTVCLHAVRRAYRVGRYSSHCNVVNLFSILVRTHLNDNDSNLGARASLPTHKSTRRRRVAVQITTFAPRDTYGLGTLRLFLFQNRIVGQLCSTIAAVISSWVVLCAAFWAILATREEEPIGEFGQPESAFLVS